MGLRMIGLRVAAVVGIVAGLATATPAYGQTETGHYPDAGWQVLDTSTPTGVWAPDADQVTSGLSRITDGTSVALEWAAGNPASNLGTSVETDNLGLYVSAGTVVSFTYRLADGAACAGGAPRVYGYFDGGTSEPGDRPGAAPDFASTDCGTDDGYGTFTVSVTTGTAGTIGYFGITYDNLTPGSVTVADLTVGGTPVLFKEPPTPTQPPTTTPPPTTEAPGPTTPAPGVSEPPPTEAAAALPVTGVSAGGLAGLAVVAMFVGGVAIWVVRRSRRTVRFVAE